MPTVQIKNHAPHALSPFYQDQLNQPMNIEASFTQIFGGQLLNPINHTLPCEIAVDGQAMSSDEIARLVQSSLLEDLSIQEQNFVFDLMSQITLLSELGGVKNLDAFFSTQTTNSNKMVHPGPTSIYTVGTDVIPEAIDVANGNSAHQERFFAALAHTFKIPTFGIGFLSETQFDEYKEFIKNDVALLSSGLDASVISLFKQFDQLSLDGLTESLSLRKNLTDAEEPFSFARVLIKLTLDYLKKTQPREASLLPFSVVNLVSPLSMVFVNVEKHSTATSTQIRNEWETIRQALAYNPGQLSTNQLNKLTTVIRTAKGVQAAAVKHGARVKKEMAKAAAVKFRQRPTKSSDIAHDLLRILSHMKRVNASQNTLKFTKRSFARANRRFPNNYNLPGKSVTTNFIPDIHIYLDTSGSISLENYESTIKFLIKLCKKLNINIYFNSFSDVLSPESLLKTANKSEIAIWKEFLRIPKVTGGTDFSLVWNYITLSRKRQEQLSVLITDFGWAPSSYMAYPNHPKNLYYAPIAVTSDYSYRSIVRYATQFIQTTQTINPRMAERLLGMT